MLHPTIRKAVLRLLRGKQPELLARNIEEREANSKKWVIVYGATNNVGMCMARVLAKHGYSLVLVDSSLDKLQSLQTDLLRAFPEMHSFSLKKPTESQADIGVASYLSQSVQIVNVNFAIWRDSTTLELKVREIFSLTPVTTDI